jgi:hypothetical protein
LIFPEVFVSKLDHAENSLNGKQNKNPHENGMENSREKDETGVNKAAIQILVPVREIFYPNRCLNQTIKKSRRQDDGMDRPADASVVCVDVKCHNGESILK